MQRKRRFCDLEQDELDDDVVNTTITTNTSPIKRRRKNVISDDDETTTNNTLNTNNIATKTTKTTTTTRSKKKKIVKNKQYYTELYEECLRKKEQESNEKMKEKTNHILSQKKKYENLFGQEFIDSFYEREYNKKQQKLLREKTKKQRDKINVVDLLLINAQNDNINNNDNQSDTDNEDDKAQWIDDEPEMPSHENFDKMKISELKELCRKIGFQVSGKKGILIGRLFNPKKAVWEKKHAHFMAHPHGGRLHYYDRQIDVINKIKFDPNKLVWKRGGIVKYKPNMDDIA